MNNINKYPRRQFLQLAQIALGSGVGIWLGSSPHARSFDRPTEQSAYYVSPTGKDSNPGTLQQPWQTIHQAANVLKAGETVYIRGGKYQINQTIQPKNSGEPGKWINYVGYPGEKPIIDADQIEVGPRVGQPPFPHDQGAFQIERKHHIKVQNLTLINSHKAGFTVRESHYIQLYNNTVINTFASGIAIWDHSSHQKILGNTVIGANNLEMQLSYPEVPANRQAPHEAISMGRVQYFEIAYNHVSSCYKEGIDCKRSCSHGKVHHNYVHHSGHQGLYVDGSRDILENVEMFHNVVHDCECGIAISTERGLAVNDIKIHHNLVFNNRATGIFISRWGEDNFRQNIEIYNNTIHHNGYGDGSSNQPYWLTGGLYFYSTNIKNIRVFNNIISDNDYFQIGYSQDYQPEGLAEKNIQIEFNWIFNQNQVTYPVYLEEWAKDYVYEIKGNQSVEAEPNFKNPTIGNFYLRVAPKNHQPQQTWGAFPPGTAETFWWVVNFPPIID
ncbi:MAG: right-handed parallel beta-helix repeat-containing protein [Microcoleaceae cyanobacterium]